MCALASLWQTNAQSFVRLRIQEEEAVVICAAFGWQRVRFFFAYECFKVYNNNSEEGNSN